MRAVAILLLLPYFGFSQEIPTLLGARVNLFNFPKKGAGLIGEKTTTGAGLSFVKGINKNLDWQLSLDFAFTDSLNGQKLKEKRMINEADISLIWLLTGRNSKVQPFLSAGAGLGLFSSQTSLVFPAGLGFRYRVLKESYLILQGQYRTTIGNTIPDHFLFGIGFYGQIHSKKIRSVNTQLSKVPLPVSNEKPSDRDGDGILDSLDVCPDEAGLLQFQGCPDSDGDGIPNKLDSCPFLYGISKYRGCPQVDSDKDGVYDEDDSCVWVAGPGENHGCPWPDDDRDSVPNYHDSCKSVAGETKYSGCPFNGTAIQSAFDKWSSQIHYDIGSDQLRIESIPILDSIAYLLIVYRGLRVAINGHTDNSHTPAFNQLLSERRSQAVRHYLIEKGIDPNRLYSIGFGDRSPIASNFTAKGRAKNRRVEIRIVE